MAENLNFMTDPLNLQKYVLDGIIQKIEKNTGTTDLSLVDPNSVFFHLVESHTSTVAQFARLVQDELDRRNPLRAQTDADLYLHMSDYDTIGSYATPSKITVALTIDKAYVVQKGVNISDNYKVLIVPKDTVIRIGTLNFGLYYPIRIKVDTRTGIPLVTYDIEEQNPLFPLKSNRVIFNEVNYMTYKLLVMHLTAYQFTKTVLTDTLDDGTGYAGSFDYSDKFYAVRLFSIKDGVATELAQSMIQDNYDPYTPTARVEVDTNRGRIVVTIPLVYFTNGLMGTKLEAHLYTTKGNITVNVGSAPVEQCAIDFGITQQTATEYNRPLMQMPVGALNITSPTTTDGSDGYTFDEKRQRVIDDSFQTKLLVTPQDLESHYATAGIKVIKYYDDLTNLIYFAYKPLTDSEGTIVPTSNSYLEVLPDSYKSVSTIKHNVDGSMTILPRTWWRVQDAEALCVPLTDTELAVLAEKDKEELITLFNSSVYARTPFFIRLNTSVTYPKATSYNLMNPQVEDVIITHENVEVAAQMLVVGENIVHLNEGTEGFQVTLVIKKDIMDDIAEDDVFVWVYCESVEGAIVGIRATFKEANENGYAIYTFTLGTDYYIDAEGNINITTLGAPGSSPNNRIALSTDFYVVFMAASSNFPGVDTLPSLYDGVPQNYRAGRTVLLRQQLTINLGHALDDVVYNIINITKDGKTYQRYEIDIPQVYEYDVYKTDESGMIVVDIIDGKPITYIEHKQGDTVYDSTGNIVYKHRAGELVLTSDGQPIETNDRIQKYQIMAPIVDAKMYVSENDIQRNFVTNLTQSFETCFELIRNSSGYISERTKIYFRPSRTIGTTTYSIGDSVTLTASLDLSFRFKVLTADNIIADAQIKQAIETAIIAAVEKYLANEIISQTEMTETIRDTVTYLESVDALGINGDVNLQTLVPLDNSVQPTVRQELYLTKDNKINIRKSITVEYVSNSYSSTMAKSIVS